MALIEVNSIVRDYKISLRRKGIFGTVENIFNPKYDI